MLRVTLAVLHLLALAIGLGAIRTRASALRRISIDRDALARAFRADAWWGVAAGLWIVSGAWRALAGTEKSPDYYPVHPLFSAKLGLLALVLALEIWPMVTLIRWRIAARRSPVPVGNARAGRWIAGISDVQTVLVVAMTTLAVLVARGYGAR